MVVFLPFFLYITRLVALVGRLDSENVLFIF